MKHFKFIIVSLVAVVILAGMYSVLRSVSTSPAPADGMHRTYVALGDSVAAGLGLQASKESGACGQSKEAYPNLVAEQLKLRLTQFSCSGAKTQDVLQNQLNSLPANPSLVTATIGANDLGWTKLLAKCYRATCGSSEDTALVDTQLATVKTNLSTLLQQLGGHPNPPRVILTGYYQVLPATKKECPRVDALQSSEFSWWQDQESKLNKTIKDATSAYAFARFAPVDFSQHDICMFGDNSWIQSIGNSAPFHPTAVGQAVIAGAVVAANQK